MNSVTSILQLRVCLLDKTSTVDKSRLDSLSFFTIIRRWSLDMLVISVAERCFWLGLNDLIPLLKNQFMQITVLIIYAVNSSTYIHRFALNIYKRNQHLHSQWKHYLFSCRSVNSFLREAVCCYVSLDSLRYFRRPTGRLAGTKREFATNAVLAAGLSGFNAHRQANGVPEI